MATNNSINSITSSNSFVSNEAVSGTQNGSNTTFTTAAAYIGGTLEVYLNGVLQARTTDYTETTPSSGEFTMDVAPLSTDVIRVCYQTSVNVTGNADTVDGFNASGTATANTLLALDADGKLPADILDTPIYGEVALGSTFTITAANDTWQSSGLAMTLPTAGTYEISYDARMDFQCSAGVPAWTSTKMYNATAELDITNSERIVSIAMVNGVVTTGTASAMTVLTVTGATSIYLYVKYKNGTPTAKNLTSNGDGRTVIRYKKVA